MQHALSVADAEKVIELIIINYSNCSHVTYNMWICSEKMTKELNRFETC